jgi:hypothetical protein
MAYNRLRAEQNRVVCHQAQRVTPENLPVKITAKSKIRKQKSNKGLRDVIKNYSGLIGGF